MAIVLGFFSGLMIYIMAAVHLPAEPSILNWFRDYNTLIFIGPWTLSTLSLLFRSKDARDALKRGFLLGAVLWLLMIPVYQKVAQSISTDSTTPPMFLIPLFLAIVCLGGFVLMHRAPLASKS